MTDFMKKYRVILFCLTLAVYCAFIGWLIPVNESYRPQISQIGNKLYSGEGVSEVRYGTSFWGSNLDKVDTVYIDGVENDKCQITYSSANSIVVDIPKEVYQEKDSFYIQVSKKAGGIYSYTGNRFKVDVTGCPVDTPKINALSTDTIYRKQGNQVIILNTENLTEECKLYVNGIEVELTADYDNQVAGIILDPGIYNQQNSLELVLAVEISGSQTLYGNVAEIEVADIDYTQWEHSYDFAEDNMFIMHAGGAWEGYTYTNCLEAFLSNYEKGCRAFEIDLMTTSDGVIVGRHDWSTVMYNSSLVSEDELLLDACKRNNLPKTYEELCNMYEGRTPLTWDDILNFLSSDDSLYIVTDTKYYNDEAVEYIFSKMAEMAEQQNLVEVLDRVAVQIYNQDMYKKLMTVYPFKSIIYTLYQSPDSNQEILDFIDNSNVKIITLAGNSSWDDDAFFEELLNRGCYIYVHTINDISLAAQYIARGCKGIYTDIITPEQLPELNEKIADIKDTGDISEEQTNISEEQAVISMEELEFNKKYLINYLHELNNEDYLVLMCVQEEATVMADDDIMDALISLGVSPDYRYAFRQSYIGIMSAGNTIYEAFSDELLEHVYVDGANLFKIKSAGHGVPELAGIMVNGDGTAIYGRGLHITVFNKKLGIIENRVVFDLYSGLNCTYYWWA